MGSPDTRNIRIELQPVTELDGEYRNAARYPFAARTRGEAEAWQSEARQALVRVLGFVADVPVSPEPELTEEARCDGYVRRKYLIRTGPENRMPFYLLLPQAGKRPLPVVLAYHGHGYGAKDVVGLWEDGSPRTSPDGYHADFGITLCRAGFAVAVPELAGFGERQNDYGYLDRVIGQPEPTTCHHAATYALMLGKSLPGMRVRDGMRLLDFLSGLDGLDAGRIGAMGISGGGMATFFHAAVDTRIRAAVVSGYFTKWRESILSMHHCTCNFVPGLLTVGELDDLSGLILPRPFLVEAGTRDNIFPIRSVRNAVRRAREIAGVFGADPERTVRFDEFEGRHRISGNLAFAFLEEVLAR